MIPGTPFYTRGTGIRVMVCHIDDDCAPLLIKLNQSAGVTLYQDKHGVVYTYVCEY